MNISLDNLTVNEYLLAVLGPQCLPLTKVIPVTIVYLVILVTGVVGNVSVCIAIARKASMHTATNYYLFSLAVSDLLLLVFGLPNDLKLFWKQYPWTLGDALCKVRAFFSEATNYASVLTVVAFSVERYVAICHPILAQTMSSHLQRVVHTVAVIWVVACAAAAPFAFFTDVLYVDFPPNSKQWVPESAFCSIQPDGWFLLLISSVVFFILPMTLIVVLYLRIALAVRRSSGFRSGETSSSCNSCTAGPKRKTVHKMLVAVVIAFFICWAPFHAQRLLFVFRQETKWSDTERTLNEVLYLVAGCFYYCNCTINPILYNLMSAKFRRAFRETLCGFLDSGPKSPSPRISSRRQKASSASSWDFHVDLTSVHDSHGPMEVDCNGVDRHSLVYGRSGERPSLTSTAKESRLSLALKATFAAKVKAWTNAARGQGPLQRNGSTHHPSAQNSAPDKINDIDGEALHRKEYTSTEWGEEIELGLLRETSV